LLGKDIVLEINNYKSKYDKKDIHKIDIDGSPMSLPMRMS